MEEAHLPAVSDELHQWVLEALELGLGCIEEGDHQPFILLSLDGKKHLVNLESKSGEIDANLVESGRDLIRGFGSDVRLYALVWDGYLKTDGLKRDAVFAEAGPPGDARAYVFAQVYRERGEGADGLEAVGRPIMFCERPSCG